ncbi:MAG TPA: hypothetical protein VF808_14555 [Ktedonobacterales bacterium]
MGRFYTIGGVALLVAGVLALLVVHPGLFDAASRECRQTATPGVNRQASLFCYWNG